MNFDRHNVEDKITKIKKQFSNEIFCRSNYSKLKSVLDDFFPDYESQELRNLILTLCINGFFETNTKLSNNQIINKIENFINSITSKPCIEVIEIINQLQLDAMTLNTSALDRLNIYKSGNKENSLTAKVSSNDGSIPFKDYLESCNFVNDLVKYLSLNLNDESIIENLTNDSEVTTYIKEKFFKNGSYESFLMKLVSKLIKNPTYKKYKDNIKKLIKYIHEKLEYNPPAYYFVYVPFIYAIKEYDGDLISEDEYKRIEHQFTEMDVKTFLEKNNTFIPNSDVPNKKKIFIFKK